MDAIRNPPRPVPPERFGDEQTYRATRLPVDYASTLIPDAYTSEEFHAQEQARVFGTAWVPVCVTDEVADPGSFLVVEVGGRSVVVCRNREGELRAHHNVCRHRGAELVAQPRGRVERFFQCPYHAWAYDLDGACLGTPLFTPEAGIPEDQRGLFDMSGVKAFDKADHGLHPVALEVWGCVVFVCLDAEAPPLADELGDLPERLAGYRLGEQRLVRRVEYEIDANWKLVAENFMEYYHLPWVHPALVKVSPMSAHYRWQGPGMYVGFCTTPIAPNTDSGGWQGVPPMAGLSVADAESARFAWVFPSMAINALPNHTFLMLTRSTAAGHTSEVTYLLVPAETHAGLDGEGERGIDELLAFWDDVNREDIEIVERVQRGLRNLAYTGGRMCYRFEESVHRFQNMVVDRMVGVRRVPEGDAEDRRPLVSPPA